jgi:hypothetical protein
MTSTSCQARDNKDRHASPATAPPVRDAADGLSPAGRRAMRRRWAELVRRVHEVDPLVCPKCGGSMRIIGVILDPDVITTILDHLRKRKDTGSRAPPNGDRSLAAAS